MAQPATVLASATHIVESRHTGGNYRINVGLPYTYAPSRAEGGPFGHVPDTWPVVYLLDANWYFGMVTDIVRSMAWCAGTSDAIVVGVGYPHDEDAQESWRESFVARNRDFTPDRDLEREARIGNMTQRPVRTGSGRQFHTFLTDELIPMIERTYRADPSNRILVGHSHAAEFGTFVLFETPELFRTYVLASPGPGNNDRYGFRREAAYAAGRTKLPANVFLSAGDLEEGADTTTLSDMLRFAAILADRRYEGFTLVKRVIQDANHCEAIAPAFQAGLKFALMKQPSHEV
jgi:uncharacterized protein